MGVKRFSRHRERKNIAKKANGAGSLLQRNEKPAAKKKEQGGKALL
jgi:hypothetical protein